MTPVALVIPIFNDWKSASLLLRGLDEVLATLPYAPEVYLIDDGSTERCPDGAFQGPYRKLQSVTVVPLKINVGHQRAIACGLVHLARIADLPETLVIMDGDGEDRPEDVPTLLGEFGKARESVIFAARAQRSEGIVFRIGYLVYKLLFTLLTGKKIRFGNFSALGRAHMEALVLAPELWLNYPAAVQKRRLAFREIPTHRGKRLDGNSQMNLSSLITHGLSAMATYNEVIGARLLMVLTVVIAFFVAGLAAVVGIRLMAPEIAVPGWATYTTGLLAILILNSLTLGLSFIFSVLGTRTVASFLPQRDAPYLIGQPRTLFQLARPPAPTSPTI